MYTFCRPPYASSSRPQKKTTCLLFFSPCTDIGDWGGIIARCLGIQHPEHCIGLHANFCVATPPPLKSPRALYTTVRYGATIALARLFLSKADAEKCTRNISVLRNETAYQLIQGIAWR